jgi:hypothetical protein
VVEVSGRENMGRPLQIVVTLDAGSLAFFFSHAVIEAYIPRISPLFYIV